MKIVTAAEAKESGDYDVAQVSESLCFATVCHRKEIESQDAIDRGLLLSGTSYGWQFVPRDELPESWWEGSGAYAGRDTPYPQPCSRHPDTHVHSVAAC